MWDMGPLIPCRQLHLYMLMFLWNSMPDTLRHPGVGNCTGVAGGDRALATQSAWHHGKVAPKCSKLILLVIERLEVEKKNKTTQNNNNNNNHDHVSIG